MTSPIRHPGRPAFPASVAGESRDSVVRPGVPVCQKRRGSRYSFLLKSFFFALFSVPVILPHPLYAEESSPVSIGLQAGAGSIFSPSGFTEFHKDPVLLGGRLGFQISDRWSVGAQLSSYVVGSSTSPSQDLRLTPLSAWAQREFPWTRLWTPYVLAGFGLSRNKGDSFSSTKSNTGWTAGLSLGLKFKMSGTHDLSIEMGARQFSRATPDQKDLRLFEGGLILRFFLPESWVPRKPNVGISDADLEIPLVSDEPDMDLDPTLLAEEEINLLQKEIDEKRIPPITFDPGSPILQTTSFQALDALGAIFRRYPDVNVRIYGFVEEGYSKDNGEALALARSQVVGTYVVQNFYLNETRFLFLGERPPPPAAPGLPPAAVLRRIEIEAIPSR
jgi:outer membrane protein OmpA-like peptidoglycan-associated protein/opacity protein-like surface antigen